MGDPARGPDAGPGPTGPTGPTGPSGPSGPGRGGRGLEAHVVVQYPALTVDVTLTVHPGEVVALVGANGAGKSTVLRAVAGLTPLDAGRIVIDGTVVDDPATDTLVAPADRRVGMMFQDYRLFPHLSALDNVAFGLRARGMPRRAARERAAAWIERVGLARHGAHRPAALSGGQAQRVALARALATEPDVLLLDEPLSALDATASAEIRDDLATHLAAFRGMTLLVSHQHADVAALAHRSVQLDHGHVHPATAPNAADHDTQPNRKV